MKFGKKVATISVVCTLVYGTAMLFAHQVNWFSDNFLYLPSVESYDASNGVVTITTISGDEYVVEVAR